MSLIPMVGKRAIKLPKVAQPSTRCEIRTLGETLIEDKGGMPSKLLMLARILIQEEVDNLDGTQTVRSCFVLYTWVQIQDWDYAFIPDFGLY